MKYILIFLVTLFLSGCSGFAKSPSDLRGKSFIKSNLYCYDKNRSLVEKEISDYLNKCFVNTSFTVVTPVGGGYATSNAGSLFSMQEEPEENGNKFTIKTRHGYTFGADTLAQESECKTQLQMYAINFMWKRNFEKIDSHIKGNEINCPL